MSSREQAESEIRNYELRIMNYELPTFCSAIEAMSTHSRNS